MIQLILGKYKRDCKLTINALYLFMLVCTVNPLRAAHEKGSSRLNLSLYGTPGYQSLYLQDDKYATIRTNLNTPASLGFFDHGYRNRLVFGIDRTVTSLASFGGLTANNSFRAEVSVNIVVNTINTSGSVWTSNVTSTAKTLTVSFGGFNNHSTTPTLNTEIDIDAFNFDNSYQTLVQINSLRIYDPSNPTVPLNFSFPPDNLFLELQYDAERYYNLSNVGLPAFANNGDLTIQTLSSPSTGNQVELKWNRIPGAEAYELEWLWLDEYTYGNSTVPVNVSWNSAPELNFRNNSTRIRTDQNTYRISNIYESGHLFFRIRGVGRCLTPAALVSMGNEPITDYFTDWTWPDISNIAVQPSAYTTAGVSGASVPWFIDLRAIAHEPDKNWVYTGAYAENGKKKEVVSYFDGAQYNRQTVTCNNSDNVALVSETYYDFVGRPTIQAMPTPVNDATIKFHQYSTGTGGVGNVGFNFNNTNNLVYDKYAFSMAGSGGTCAGQVSGFSNMYGTGKYYSGNNPFQSLNYNNGYTPDAFDFPFTQTEYLPDNTGRVARQSGLGPDLKIENSGADKHDTRYLYGSVTQDELDKLFGSEAGNAAHYSKKTVIDANGGITISYTNLQGKVVATALSGSAPNNLEAMQSSDGTVLAAVSTSDNTDLLNKVSSGDYDTPADKNNLKADELIFTEKITVAMPQTHYFDYSLVSNQCYAASPNICYDCVYDLAFDITDQCGNRPAGFTPVIATLGNISIVSPNAGTPLSFSFKQLLPSGTNSIAVFLPEGMYTVSKKLTVNKQALDAYLKHYMGNVVDQPATYDLNELANLDKSGCDNSCAACAAGLDQGVPGSYTTALLAANPGMSNATALQQYKNAVKKCYEPCEVDDLCGSLTEALLSDVTPSGQYAEFSGSGSSFSALSYPLSIFNPNSSLPRRGSATDEPWKHPESFEQPGTFAYLDENGAADKIIVTRLSANVYDPPLQSGANTAPVPGTTDQFYADPQSLQNSADFVSLFKPTWAKSLLKYHPEYPYIQWCQQNRSITVPKVTVGYNVYNNTGVAVSSANFYYNNSFGYDSLYAAIDDIDDIVASSLPIMFDPLTYDPYWTTTGKYYLAPSGNNPTNFTLPNPAEFSDNNGTEFQRQGTAASHPVDFSASANLYNGQKTNKTAYERFLNYKGTGFSIIQVAAFLATPLANQPGQSLASQINKLLNTSNSANPLNIYYPNALLRPATNPLNPMDMNYILGLVKPGSTNDDSYKRKAWNNFKSMYAAMKQEMQAEAAQSYVMNSANRGCNDCIGKADFDVNSVKYTTYSNEALAKLLSNFTIVSAPFHIGSLAGLAANLASVQDKDWFKYPLGNYALNKEQVCGLATKDLYKNKIKRYQIIESTAVDPDVLANNSGANIYQQTGLCPNAYDLQEFLNGMARVGELFHVSSSGYDLNANVPEFSQNLYKSICPVIPSPFVAAKYKMLSSTNPNLQIRITIGTNTDDILITMPASVTSPIPSNIISWANYQGSTPVYTISSFGGLLPNSSNNFNVIATVLGPGATTTAPPISYTIQLTGHSLSLLLTGCTFQPPCKSNGNGKALNALLNTFASNAVFPAPYNGSAYTSCNFFNGNNATSYSYIFTSSWKPLLETPGNPQVFGWNWSYNNSNNEILITDGNPTSTLRKQMIIKFTFPTGSPDPSCIQSFRNFRPDPASSTGGFLVDGVISNAITNCASGIVALSGTASIGVYGTTFLKLDIGGCSFDLNTCNTQEHETKKDLEKWVLSSPSGFGNIVNSTTSDISGNLYFTQLLRSYLNPPLNTSGVPQQNYYWWFKDTNPVNTNNDQISGWLCVTTSNSAPLVPPSDGCRIVVKRKTPGGTSVNTLLGNIGTFFALARGPYINNSVYDFKLCPTGSGVTNQDSLLVSTTCFPMKTCESCSGSVVVPQQASTLNGNPIQNYNNVSSFSLKRGATNYNYKGTLTQLLASGQVLNDLDFMVVNPLPSQFPGQFHFADFPAEVRNNPSTCSTYYSGLTLYYASAQGILFSNVGCFPNPEPVPTIFSQNFTSAGTGNFGIATLLTTCGGSAYNDFSGYKIYFRIFDAGNNLIYSSANMPQTLNSNWMSWATSFFPHGSVNLIAGNSYKLEIEFQNLEPNNLILLHPIFIDNPYMPGGTYPCTNTNNQWPTDTMPTANYEEPCGQFLEDLTDNTADEKYQADADFLKNEFIRKYIKHCLGRAVETLTMKTPNNDYHYTLYYYDQAGNLRRTVPPEGVKPINLNASYAGGGTMREAIIADRTNYGTNGYTQKVYTNHQFLSTYKYNSLNQLTWQETPDAGISKFYYDNLGRLVASQNAQQKHTSSPGNNHYSYTRYDALGRITMVGQLGSVNDLDAYPLSPPQTVNDILSDANYPFNLNIVANSHREVTQTHYGDGNGASAINVAAYFNTGSQKNLRNRVAAVSIEDVYDGNPGTYNHATHYSYDIHGNVNELVQDNPDLGLFSTNMQKIKHLQYSYDLISGNVNSVTYQNGKPDMMMHRYAYDANNRITNVYSSRDGLLWDQDAKYYYYLHGPLARVETGEHKVQSSDYAYTLQGWLKGVNSEALQADNDMGKDGYGTLANGGALTYDLNRFNARDAYGYALTYYSQPFVNSSILDYAPVNGTYANSGTYFLAGFSEGYTDATPPLYNGNISRLSTCYLNPDPTPANLNNLNTPLSLNKYDPYCLIKNFRYDQLNRIKSSVVMAEAVDQSNIWNFVNGANASSEYAENFNYDQNGNILSVKRELSGQGAYDDMTYYYYDAAGNPFNPASPQVATVPTNKLAYVDDAGNNSILGDDIKGGQGNHNYQYDKIGNLVADASENIANIEWTGYGKIKKISYANYAAKPNIEFRYDAAGNRVSKKLIISATHNITTYYVRDAQGNVMATYEHEHQAAGNNATYSELLKLKELNIYGSQRLGLIATNDVLQYIAGSVNLNTQPAISAPENKRILGNKFYELSNHLGNVVAVISDRKLAVDVDNDYSADYFVPDMQSATDYYAFGSPMPGRQFNSGNYRYGFNGKENDNEAKGTGNQQDYGMRIYDSRVAKFLSVDPLTKSYPSLSPYPFAMNSPIAGIDMDGLEFFYTADGKYLGKYGTSTQVMIKKKEGTEADILLKIAEATKNETPEKDFKETMSAFSTDLNMTHDNLITAASVAFGEATEGIQRESYEEMNSIASIYVSGRNQLAYALNADGAKKFQNTDDEKRNESPRMKLALRATIDAKNGIDYSGGAKGWDGREQGMMDGNSCRDQVFGRSYESHAATHGWTIRTSLFNKWKTSVDSKFGEGSFKAPQHNRAWNWDPPGKVNYQNGNLMRNQATAVWNQTIFWKDRSGKKAETEDKR